VDVDAGNDQLRITLTATNGTLSLSTTGGLTFVTGDGNDDAAMSFTGALSSLNSALAGLTFKPSTGFSGSANIQVSTDDLGHNGSGGAQTDTDVIFITVRAGGVLQFNTASYQALEDGVLATIVVTRTGGNGGATSVNYSSTNGTANGGATCAQGVDYLNASGTLSWSNNDSSAKMFTITLCPDSLNEQDETINIALSNAIGSGSLGTRTAATLTIINDDSPTVQLSQSAYSISESGGSLSVQVTRTDATSAARVDYATSDIAGLTPCNTFNTIASSRCDYATTIGRLQFAAGEASKTIFIPVVDDGWADGTENFTLTLSNPSGAILGTNTSATVTITDNDANSNASNPIDQNAFFVRQQYIDFLGREPDAAGFQGWQDVLNNCGTTIQQPCDKIEVSAGFFRSKEFQERGYFIYKFYSAVGRIPLYPEFMPDLAKVSGFLSDQELEANKDAFVTEFMARSDYQTLYGAITDPTAYVNALLNTVGLPNHPSRDGWIAGLANNSLTKAKVFRELTESSEMQAKYRTESFVIMQYFGYLRRSADASYLAWIDIMNQNPTNYRGMIDGFINSDEYRKRFGQ
jgi:hypothetical protein